MKKLCFVFTILCLAAAGIEAQVDRLTPAKDFATFRPLHDSRIWNFEIDKQNIGNLTSTVTGEKSIDGVEGYVLEQLLSLDFTKAGTELTMHSEGKQYIAPNGAYLGCDLKLDINGQKSTLVIRRDGERLAAKVIGEGGKSESVEPFPKNGFGFELFYLDLMENYVAFKGGEVGQTIGDTLYSIQSMLPVPFNALCLDFRYMGLFTGKYDSVFIFNVSVPESYRLFINRTGHLAKVEMPNRKLKIYQDFAGQSRQPEAPQAPGFSLSGLAKALPVAALYFGFAAAIISLLAWRGWKRPESFEAFVFGFAALILLPFTLHPLQSVIVDNLVVPSAQRGESLYLLALLPSLLAGLFLTGLLVLLLEVGKKLREKWRSDLSANGAFLGAGLAVAESIYTAATIPASFHFSMMLLERAAYLILLSVVGALLGRAAERGPDALVSNATISVLLITGFKYLPILVQRRIVQLELMYILSLLMAVIVLGVSMVMLARSKAALVKSRKGR